MDSPSQPIHQGDKLIRKIVLPLLVIFTMVLTACAPAATPSPEIVIEPTQVPTQEPTVVVPTLAATQKVEETQSGMMNILDTIKADENLSLFYEALILSGAGDMLKGKGPFTVFAPTNDAINAVPSLYSMEQFAKIISNHIVSGRIMTADLLPGKLNLAYPESGDLIVFVFSGDVWHLQLSAENAATNTTDVTMITADIETSNGVLHVIDAMLLAVTDK